MHVASARYKSTWQLPVKRNLRSPYGPTVPLASQVAPWKRIHSLMQGMQDTRVQPLGREGALEEGTATRSSALAWRIPWTEEPGGLQSMGSQRVGHN